MCGIAGTYQRDARRPDAGVASAMVHRLLHRGPDGVSVTIAGAAALAFSRLAIVDLDAGADAHRCVGGDVTAVCNGELYNAPALRRELEAKGHRFRTGCDTEVVPHLVAEYGARAIERLDGQFALAIHDGRSEKLLLARDPFGVLPLFWAPVPGGLAFASEIKGLVAHPGVPAVLDLAGLDQVLSLPGLVSPRTVFHGVSSLEPGCLLVADRDGTRLERFWDLDYPEVGEIPPMRAAQLDQAADEVLGLLEQSVAKRLQADVPVGIYLSGGLDSSLLAVIAQRVSGTGRRTFGVTFPDADIDEGRHQLEVASAVGADHRLVPLGPADVVERLRTVVRHAEAPVKESYDACSLALAESARADGVPVVLAGEGADELFGGYPGYRFDRARREGSAGERGEELLERRIRERMFGDDVFYEQDQLPLRDLRRDLYHPDLLSHLADFEVTGRSLVDGHRLRGRHPFHQRSYLDCKLRLADHLLGDHGDRMGMARAVELRYPFLDRDVVAHTRSLSPDLMLADGVDKAILRRIGQRLLPPSIARREKYGFRAPTSPALVAAAPAWFDEVLDRETIRRQGIFQVDAVEHLHRRAAAPDGDVHAHLDLDALLLVATCTVLIEDHGIGSAA